jgi:peptide/nickel transport system substrate-binding protein
MPAADVQQTALKNREYEAILFGQAAYLQSDPFSFWHSSQKGEGGLNFSLFENKEADETLEKLRTTVTDENAQKDLYKKFLEIFYQENPALMLYSPSYLYVQSADVKGLETTRINTPSSRLSNVKHWFINTSRSWK